MEVNGYTIKPRADLLKAKLAGAKLAGADLTGANLALANLRGANLALAHLTGANLRGANLTDVDFTNANLTNANLTNANLLGTDLSGTFGAPFYGTREAFSHFRKDGQPKKSYATRFLADAAVHKLPVLDKNDFNSYQCGDHFHIGHSRNQ